MRAKWCGIFFLFIGSISLSALADLELKVGEKKVLGNKVQGVASDNPQVADVHMLKDARVEIAAKEGGEATISLYSTDGKLQMYQLRVRPNQVESAQSSGAAWQSSRFGGKKIANARCTEPLEDEGAASALQDARDLLRQEHVEDAVRALESALAQEPDAAVVHLYLGAAWAKLSQDAKGASSYETYVLSCPREGQAQPVIRLLRDFEHRGSSKRE